MIQNGFRVEDPHDLAQYRRHIVAVQVAAQACAAGSDDGLGLLANDLAGRHHHAADDGAGHEAVGGGVDQLVALGVGEEVGDGPDLWDGWITPGSEAH